LSLPSFISMTGRPVSLTLFPYTTLFRSWGISLANRFIAHRWGCRKGYGACVGLPLDQVDPQQDQHAPQGVRPTQPFAVEHAPHQDRKSTRLNSSHVKISYAVFCLKKKNQ